MNDGPSVTLGIKFVPPVLYLGMLAVTGVLEFFWPTDTLATIPQLVVGLTLAAVPWLVVPRAISAFKRAGTPFNVKKPATALVTDGVMRYTRNPGYVGLSIIYLGVAVAVDSLWMLAGLMPVLLLMHFHVILREEAHLESVFGEEYLVYKSQVRRWI